MSYTQAIDEVKAAVEAISGLTYTTAPRVSTLLEEGRAGLSGHFSLEDMSGPQPWPELAITPTWWFCQMRLEIGFEVTTDKLEQGKTLEGWAAQVVNALRFAKPHLTYATVYGWEAPIIERDINNKRSVWIAQFKIRYQS
ncbi:MAG: hypothetical protein ABIK28_16045 [Planctomycetota bacterium]